MERITNKKDDLNQQIRPGTAWVSGFTQPGNNDDIRAIDSDHAEMRVIPVSRYYASKTIKRGQALSIAQLSDLTQEQKGNKYAYVKPTNPDLDETCIGISMNYAEEGQIVHIQNTGKFNFYTTDSILYETSAKEREIFLKGDAWSFDKVRGQKLYIKKLYDDKPVPGSNPSEVPGDEFDTDHSDKQGDADTEGWFTYDLPDSIYNSKNTIQIGYLTDAPTTKENFYYRNDGGEWFQAIKNEDGSYVSEPVLHKDCVIVEFNGEKVVTSERVLISSTGIEIPENSIPPKANEATWMQALDREDFEGHKCYVPVEDLTVTVELEVTGDTRGPVDNTQFLMTLGETIYFDTKKQDVELNEPNLNEGIFDELKVVAIAPDKPSSPCFRIMMKTPEIVAYQEAKEYSSTKKYYKRKPGNIYEFVGTVTKEEFDNPYVKAETYEKGITYYSYDTEKKTFVKDPTLSKVDFMGVGDPDYYYKEPYFEAKVNLNKAFIGLRKVDGDTLLIPVLCDFEEEDLAGGAALIDPNDEGYYRLSLDFTNPNNISGSKRWYLENGVFEERTPRIMIADPVLSLSRDTLKEAIEDGMKKVFSLTLEDEEKGTVHKIGCTPKTYDIGDNGFQFMTEETEGTYEIYVSSELLNYISATTVRQGQSAEAGSAILADIRDSQRLNVIGVVLNNESGVRHKGDVIKVMRLGRIVTLGNLHPGQEYFLGLQGHITAKAVNWYDRIVYIGTAESANYFIVDADSSPKRTYSGNFPLGYLKPSVFGMAEKGFLLADGRTAYSKEENPELYNLLLNFFDEEELDPNNVSEDLYNKYTKWELKDVFTNIFMKIAALEALRVDTDTSTQQLEEAYKEMKEAYEEARLKLSALENQVQENINTLNQHALQIEGLQENIQEVDTARTNDKAELERKIEENSEEISKTNQNLSDLETSLREADSRLNESIQNNTESIDRLSSSIGEVSNSLNSFKSSTSNSFKGMQGSFNTLNDKVGVIEGEVNSHKEIEIPKIKEDINRINRKIGEMNPEDSPLVKQIQNLKNKDTDLQGKIDNLNKDFTTEKESLNTSINNIKSSIGEVGEGTTLVGQITGLQTTIGDKPSEETWGTLVQEIQKLQNSIQDINKKIGDAETSDTILGSIKGINDMIGKKESPNPDTILGRIQSLEDQIKPLTTNKTS